MKKNPFLLFPSSLVAGVALLSSGLHAAITWDAGGSDNQWSTFPNWSSDASPAGDDVTFNNTGALASGVTNTVGTSESIASLAYSHESATLQHTTQIQPGQTLAVSGNFSIGGTPTATLATNAAITGATGIFTVGGASFQVGQVTPTTGTNTTSLDMSGLGTFTATVPASGSFRLGPSVITTAGALATVKLAATSSITVGASGTLGIGDRAGRTGLHVLKLGSVLNTINTPTLNIGSTAGRGSGELSFETSSGSLILRGSDGVAPVTTVNIVNHGINTSATQTGTANFTGHSVDAKITTLTMARRTGTGTSAGSTATLTFDAGTLEVGTANLAVNTNAGLTGTTSATLNIGGGTASLGAVTMATSSGGGTTNATINLTGGTTTVAGTGGISKVGGTGTTNASLSINGANAVLDMSGGNITGLNTITYTDGLIRNLGVVNTGMALAGTGSRVFEQLNDVAGTIQGVVSGTGVGLSKSGTGTLTLAGANTYDGLTQIDAGGLIFASKSAKTAAVATAAAAGSVGLGVHDSNALYYSAADVASLISNTLTGFNPDPASGVMIDTSNAGGTFTQNIALDSARLLTKVGTGTLVLPLANTHTGNIQINGTPGSNTLRAEHNEALGPVGSPKTITLTGANRNVSILELANGITVDISKKIATSGKSYIAAGETSFGSPVFLRSASGNNIWKGDVLIAAAGGGYTIETVAGSLTLGDPATASVIRNDVTTSTTIRAVNFLGAGDVVVNSRFVDTNPTTSTGMNKHGTGTLTLPRTDNEGTLATPVFAVGTTIVENLSNSGAPSSIGAGTSFNFGGTFRHAGAADSTCNRPFGLIGPSPTLESSGAGALALTSTTAVALVNGAGTPLASFAAGDTVLSVRDAHTLFPGMTLAGTNIAAGTKITAVNYDTRQITVDTPTTAAQTTHQNATVSGTANLDRTFTLAGTNTGDNLIAAPIQNPTGTGKLSLTKSGTGKWILSGTNTYTGNTTIQAGTLALGSATALPDASPVSVGGATLSATASGIEDASTLTITGAAGIQLSPGAKIEFDDSSGIPWTGTLQITGSFVSGSSLRFGTTGTGLTGAQISGISAPGFTGFALDANGFLTATSTASNYASWANDPLKGNIPGEPAGGDFDQDGLSNLMEYALGKNPRTSSQPAGTLSGNIVSFTKGADAIANGDVSWVIETSSTLAPGSWTAAVTQTGGDPSPAITHTFTPGTPASNFARLKVITP